MIRQIVVSVLSVNALAFQGRAPRIAELKFGPIPEASLHGLLYQKQTPEVEQLLKVRFSEAATQEERKSIARTLVKLGDEETVYFNFLSDGIDFILSDAAPFCVLFDERGQPIRGRTTAEFDNWCIAKGINREEEAEKQIYGYQMEMLKFGDLIDSRAIPYLRRGLTSRNPYIVKVAVEGLAQLGRSEFLDEILDAAGRFPRSAGDLIAKSLAGFSDSRSRIEFERLVNDPGLRKFLQQDAERKRVDVSRQIGRRSLTQSKK